LVAVFVDLALESGPCDLGFVVSLGGLAQISVGLNVALALSAVWWAPLRELLRTERMSLSDLVPCLVTGCVAGAVAWLQARRPRR
jgi:hypothetical protein